MHTSLDKAQPRSGNQAFHGLRDEDSPGSAFRATRAPVCPICEVRSDMPVPRLSKGIRRQNEAETLKKRARARDDHTASTFDTKPGAKNHVERSIADHLVGDMYVAATGVACFGVIMLDALSGAA